jgi:predicted signal transduction protein with EAL and GGDEF domain
VPFRSAIRATVPSIDAMPLFRALRDPSLRLYVWLSRRGWPRSYAGKLLLVAFLGTHVPLLTLLAFFVGSVSPSAAYTVRVLAVAVMATLAGTIATLYALHRLLAPMLVTQRGLRQYRRDRELPHLPTGFADEAGVLMADTQQTLAELERSMRRLELFDAVTGLPNSALFIESVSQTRATVRRTGAAIAVLDVFGIDDAVSALGPNAREVLLRGVTSRLSASVREGDVVARVGDSSFAVMGIMAPSAQGVAATASTGSVPDAALANALLAQANRLLDAISRPIPAPDVRGVECVVHLGAAAGVATFPADATEPDALLAHAQSAARDAVARARSEGQSVVTGFSAELHAAMQERDLRIAMERDEFVLEYQPKVDLATGYVSSVEALVRWRHPERGLVQPAAFIPAAEASGLIVPIGAWVLASACAQAKRWAQSGRPLRVAVNLSAQQVMRGDVVALVRRVLAETGLPAQLLELEVTESLFIADLARATSVLGELRALGVSVALDDFGTGYSSLSYLRTLPVTTVKIDRAFVRDLGGDAAGGAIVDAVLAMARGLSLSVVAEGVETEAQLEYLRQRGCDVAQGFYFARPMSPDQLTSQLAPDEAPEVQVVS